MTVSDCLKSLGEFIDIPQPRFKDSGKGKENEIAPVYVEVKFPESLNGLFPFVK